MSTIKDGGPAFPQPNQAHPGNPNPDNGPGMSLRDFFAAKALQALFDSDAGHRPEEMEMIASEAYAMADAMLKVRDAK